MSETKEPKIQDAYGALAGAVFESVMVAYMKGEISDIPAHIAIYADMIDVDIDWIREDFERQKKYCQKYGFIKTRIYPDGTKKIIYLKKAHARYKKKARARSLGKITESEWQEYLLSLEKYK